MKLHKIETPSYIMFVDEYGRKQGTFKEFYEDGRLEYIYNYVDDLKHGDYKGYTKDGEILVHTLCINGEFVHRYHINGPLSAEDKFELCLKHGHLEFL